MPPKPEENRINPAKLSQSKWTAAVPVNREKHFLVTEVISDEAGCAEACLIEAVVTGSRYEIDWRQLKDRAIWLPGWL